MAEPRILRSKTNPNQFAMEVPGGGMQAITAAQAESILSGKGLLETFGDAASLTSANLLLGAQSLLGDKQAERDLATGREQIGALSAQNPAAAMAGQIAPAALGGGLGAMGGGLGIVGTEAAMGAAFMPEAPLTGAAIGAAIPGVAMGIGPATRAVGRMAEGIPGMGIGGGGGLPVPGIPTNARMADRVTARVGGTEADFIGPPQPRYYKGIPGSNEFDELGIPLSPSQRMTVDARGGNAVEAAKRARWVEDLRGQSGQFAPAQRMAFSNMVKEELGLPANVGLTDTAVGGVMKSAGDTIGRIADNAGPIQIKDMAGLKKALEYVGDSKTGPVNTIVKDIESSIAKNGGAISPTDFQLARTRLVDLSNPANDYAVQQAARKVMVELEDALARGLSAGQKAELRQARYQWKVGSHLMDRAAARGGDFEVNPRTFGNNWDKTFSKKMRGQDKLGRWADAMSLIAQQEGTAGTTLQRVFANAPSAAKGMIRPAAGLIGAGAAGGVVSGLLRD